ncbi:MAG: adenylate/guanylate cyclase domain-containing protein [Lentisphaerae bacterium]|jgi:adenylate cyclase|nr:adenylate/guanylate cyclase domain-containing protein [Lentisphaerota bacterium]MBT4817129.1 adenylate/guanylate cyclase domain-containing protein [Lentisphaerota bacterium]MBT5610414.1 adenylate/guanylate cyclase domain-containing protein [Lentisphaerota bacterium]MBT7060191.1 adenylate/guanylate cyclase domain-containing protein [Lentisphaerota bacterium]MBT7842206.1 adenylate/guanylate cyclase domain-containing protein [Lentisphaerota bacterium]
MSPAPARPSVSHTHVLPDDAKTETMGITFFDLSRFAEWSSTDDDARVASFLQTFYALAAEHLEPVGARIVKFMGDAGLAVFPTDVAEQAIFALCAYSHATRTVAREYGLDTYLNVNIHVGSVVSGSFGVPGAERFDVIGKAVNVAARLGRRGVTLSAQAFRCLSPEGRARFQKLTPPTTYRFTN